VHPPEEEYETLEEEYETDEIRQMVQLARLFARGGGDDDVDDRELLNLLAQLRVKSNCKRNEVASRMLDVLHRYPEFAAKRRELYGALVLPGKNWWTDHKKDRAHLREQYGL
jgi:hypothetical protein